VQGEGFEPSKASVCEGGNVFRFWTNEGLREDTNPNGAALEREGVLVLRRVSWDDGDDS
jgi:hypothetical protein